MPISELGYRGWEGKRVHPGLRWLAIARSDIRIAYRGSKTLRRFLVLAWMPILYFGPLFFGVGWLADPANDLAEGGVMTEVAAALVPSGVIDQLRSRPDVLLPAVWAPAFYVFFSLTQFLSLIIIALVAPPLISRDVRSKAFLLYFSKPISSWEYLLGKLSVVLFFAFAITLFPALLLYVISIAFSPDLRTLAATAPIIARLFGAAIVASVPASVVALLLSSLTKDHRIATLTWMAAWLIGWVAHTAITVDLQEGFRPPDWVMALSLRELALTGTAAMLDLSGYLRQLWEHLQGAGIDARELLEQLTETGSGPLHDAVADAMDPGAGASAPPSRLALLLSAGLTIAGVALLRRRVNRPVRI